MTTNTQTMSLQHMHATMLVEIKKLIEYADSIESGAANGPLGSAITTREKALAVARMFGTLAESITKKGDIGQTLRNIDMTTELYKAITWKTTPKTTSQHAFKTLDGNTPFRKLSNQIAAEQRT